MAKQAKQYMNGVFVTKVEGSYGPFFRMGIKKEEFIKNLNALEADAKGFVNFTMSEQRADASKYSVAVDTWKPEVAYPTSADYGSKSKVPANASAYDDSLPF